MYWPVTELTIFTYVCIDTGTILWQKVWIRYINLVLIRR